MNFIYLHSSHFEHVVNAVNTAKQIEYFTQSMECNCRLHGMRTNRNNTYISFNKNK